MTEAKNQTYEGVTMGFFETGTEGVIWSVYKDGGTGYEGLVAIKDSDYLTVWDPTGAVLFDGKVVCDYKTGWQEYPLNPGHGQQVALDMWVHWIQKGVAPDDWARLFFPLQGENRAKICRPNGGV